MKNIETLRQFFRISNAAFDFANTIKSATGQPVVPDAIQVMHKRALEELEKDNPDMELIDSILSAMEAQALLNKRVNAPAHKFPSGGVVAGAEIQHEKPFPVFWYESNATWGRVAAINELITHARLQLVENNGLYTIDGFLDMSRCSTTRQFCRKDGAPSFGTRHEHTGEQTLRTYLQEHGLLDEFLETWNK